MDSTGSNLFKTEDAVLKEAHEIMQDNGANLNLLREKYGQLAVRFAKLLGEMKKIVKISDGQQEYLHSIQNDLKQEIENRKKIEERLRYLVSNDVLTGVYNRGMGLTILDNHLKAQKRSNEIFSICYFDINGLKYVNDNFGHAEGDVLLVTVCGLIKNAVRECDTVCRLGGDEFLIILPQCTEESVNAIIGRIMLKIAEENGKNPGKYDISFSYGIVEINPDNKKTLDELLELADKRMYKNKRENKRVSAATPKAGR